jgi:penicillin-binding protein 2
LRSPRIRFLPGDPRVEEPYRLTPQLALRIAVLGAAAFVVFAVLFLRLWALQVLSGAHYANAAVSNQVRRMPIEAPRGPILDREGRVLVTNVPGTAVKIWTSDLPRRGRLDELWRLARIVHMRPRELVRMVASHTDALTPLTVKEAVHEDQVEYLQEHKAEFPGVAVSQSYLRYYNSQALAAQILGYVREISPSQLRSLRKLGYRAGDKIGQGGVEAAFDRYLRGQAGDAELQVDSLGRPRSGVDVRRAPVPGYAIRLTIDVSLQRAAEQALAFGIRLAHVKHNWAANGGAIVALDPHDGAILAMASNPTYKPSIYVGRVDPQKLAPLLDQKQAAAANYPGLNRAVAGVYPPGSTFKPVTALAAMEEHVVSPYDALACTGSYKVHGQTFMNWDPGVNTTMTMPVALAASCDTYFYQLGYDFYGLPPNRGHPLQAWASRFGFGQTTGLDIGGEAAGLLPTPEWRQQTYTRRTDPGHWQIDRLWKPGDSIQLAIGQKDLLVTPLQMARFYAVIASGGKLVTPYLVQDVEQPGDDRTPTRVERRFMPPPPQPTGVDPAALRVVQEGLYAAAHDRAIGTSAGIFADFPVPVAGKTGTAEKVVNVPGYPKGHLESQAWWCGYAPSDKPELVVCALIENGGHGGEVAAPAALKVFEQYFGERATSVQTGNSD